jgi:hypothetical protein
MKALTIITALLLLFAILRLPYGYHPLLRVVVTMSCGAVIVKEYELRNYFWCSLFIMIALLFNPIIPIHLYKKAIWAPIDIACGILFLVKTFVPLRVHKER